jgi:hypothetical protein
MIPTDDHHDNVHLSTVLAQAGSVGRGAIEKHLVAIDEEVDPSHGELWRRLFLALARLAPLPVKGRADAVMFFVPDGPHRMQMFALEDQRDGVLHVYLPDVLDRALDQRLLRRTEDPDHFAIVDEAPGATPDVTQDPFLLRIDRMDSANSPNPPEHVKHMLGWNRKAIRLTLIASDSQSPRVAAAERLSALALERAKK